MLEPSLGVQSLQLEKWICFLFETLFCIYEIELVETSKAFNSIVTLFTVSFQDILSFNSLFTLMRVNPVLSECFYSVSITTVNH